MFCTSCGTKNSEDGNFCKQCGLRLDKPAHNKISEQDFERAMPEDEQVTSLLERAYIARKSGDRLGAIALCHEALDLRPTSTSCHSLLGQLYEQGGERELAIEQYEKVMALNPGSIADRVKLDELRGDVPSVVSTKRSQPHIVIADRGKDNSPIDYRGPSFVLACVALMVLGGIFTMQMLSRQGGSQRSGPDSGRSQAANSGIQTANTQAVQAAGQPSIPNQNVASADPGFPGVTGFGERPIIIQNTPAPNSREYPPAGYGVGPAGIAATVSNHPATTTNSAQDDSRDIDTGHVHLGSSEDNKTPDVDPAPATPKGTGKITVNDPKVTINVSSTGTGASAGDNSTGSNTRKNEQMADLLAQQGQYKQAGDAYLHALDGAGDDTAYVYRQAAWCFEKAGEKTTAVSYYQHGMRR